MGSDDENEIETKALLKMINGLAKASSASVARLNDLENKLAVKDQALAKVESDLGAERQIVADLQGKVNAHPGGGSGSERVLSEGRIERTFGEDTSPKALNNAFLSPTREGSEQQERCCFVEGCKLPGRSTEVGIDRRGSRVCRHRGLHELKLG